MLDAFEKIVGMSLVSGAAVTVVLILREVFTGISAQTRCILWTLIGLRVILSYSFGDLILRLFPSTDYSKPANVIRELFVIPNTVSPTTDFIVDPAPLAPSPKQEAALPSLSPADMIIALWLAGATAILLYIIVSYIRVAIRLRTATRSDIGVYQSDRIAAPFVFGIINPKIYIPYSLTDNDIPYVLEHERSHIKRNDHIAKLTALLILAVHWFNPLIWVAFAFFCRDMEIACDESVVAPKSRTERQRYSTALLSCSIGGDPMLCSVAFGEVGVKERIKYIMNFRFSKHGKALSLTTLFIAVLCIFTLPVGCSDSSDTSSDSAPTAQVDVELASDSSISESESDIEYTEGMNRVLNDDGSVIMMYNSYSNIAFDSTQAFTLDVACTSLSVSPNGGTVVTAAEDGRVDYMVKPQEINCDAYTAVYWIPQEIYAFSSDNRTVEDEGQAKSGTITFKAYSDNSVIDTAVVTFNSNKTDDAILNQLTYTFSADKDHILVVNEDNSITVKPLR